MTERTLIIIKPDGIQRHLAGQITGRLEQKGFKLVAAKFLHISEDKANQLYSVHKGKPFLKGLLRFITSSPSLVMVWEAEGIIEMARKMMGATFGSQAEPGSIRGDYGCSNRFNLVHGSDSTESAEREISIFFKPEEIVDYEFTDAHWVYGTKD